MLNLLHTKTFLAVIDARGFRAAARVLGIAPSTVVDHVGQLEAELGAPLIARRRGAVRPTPQGAALLPLARALVSTAERARTAVMGAPLRLAASSNIGTYLLQAPLAAFRRRGGSNVDLWIGSNPAALDRLTQGAADIAVMECWQPADAFEAHDWRREKLVLIVAPSHRWADRESVRPDELIGEPLLGGERGTGTGTLLRRRLGAVAGQLSTIDGFGNTEAVKRAVREGLGVSLVMKASVIDEIASGALVALPLAGVELVKETKIVLPRDMPATAPARRFLAHALA
ncbi:LysR family transcriptional regulator [Parvibaculum sp.]|uniref:LysR family transcriptional regulator n=1 Tax=Parvibaculum sp. TaxID=2024848 RepID=UPI0034A09749